ncbi:hypothetical protein [Absidia glauca]|uniref:Uncharacterized protein n=1 Tax=Absidia glauca TaxID=4829 RepID=A0A168S0V2_ABSGL|nr:hypothetical protein [Absidia glauca]
MISFVQPTVADLLPPHDASHWTAEKVNAFMKKHNLGYDKHVDESLMTKKIQHYEKAAMDTARHFGIQVDHFTKAIQNQLETQKTLTQQDIDYLISDIRHHLRQLELQGQLSGDKVGQALDKVRRQVANKKTITDSSWKSIKNDALARFYRHEKAPLWQRVFSSRPASSSVNPVKQSIDQWLDQVQGQLQSLQVMTDQQLVSVMDQLRRAVIRKNIDRLASPHWYERLYYRLALKAELTEKQLEHIKDTLEQEVNGYKVFASDYLTHQLTRKGTFYDRCCHAADTARTTIEDWVDDMLTWLSGAKNKQVIERMPGDLKEQDWKMDFDRYWDGYLLEAYQLLGYSEAQINHIKERLTQVFASTNKKSLAAKTNVVHGLESLKQYMQLARVQSTNQIQDEIDKIKHQLETWKAKPY